MGEKKNPFKGIKAESSSIVYNQHFSTLERNVPNRKACEFTVQRIMDHMTLKWLSHD
jgi:hypothetical protein